mmetsp:Transcript_21004/g.45555  ORF Transcript_21004/g.45555 Transcript_21004/m.45555 type:complete len:238 (+) Transcript_21004:723-1436(+)
MRAPTTARRPTYQLQRLVGQNQCRSASHRSSHHSRAAAGCRCDAARATGFAEVRRARSGAVSGIQRDLARQWRCSQSTIRWIRRSSRRSGATGETNGRGCRERRCVLRTKIRQQFLSRQCKTNGDRSIHGGDHIISRHAIMLTCSVVFISHCYRRLRVLHRLRTHYSKVHHLIFRGSGSLAGDIAPWDRAGVIWITRHGRVEGTLDRQVHLRSLRTNEMPKQLGHTRSSAHKVANLH